MADNLTTLLESVVQDVDRPVMRMELVHAREIAQILSLNQTERALPARVRGFHELIAEQARRTPERTAVIDAQGSLSYGELAACAEQWSLRLAERGIGRGHRVGVALGRNRRVLELVLGIAGLGATYVPLDPSLPSERLAFMIDDAALSAIVAEQATRAALPESSGPVWLAEQLGSEMLARRFEPPAIDADDLAYIIYTSGSTGKPKGVEVRHRSVVNLLLCAQRTPGIREDDRVLAVSTFSFDISMLELFLPLTIGACTMLAPRECAADGAQLARSIDRSQATIVQATPTTFSLLVHAGMPRRSFKVLVGGEALPPSLVRALSARSDEIWNCYGPTETTVWSSFQRVRPDDAQILIGRPIANTRMYVLDAQRELVPFGVAGELYIGGIGVAAGYRNRPELTHERFVADPFAGDAQARMYRTGDIVRLRPEGLAYVGRADHQIKLRGHRIELGEIEQTLSSVPGVDRCAVVVHDFAPGDQRLVGYYALAQGAKLAADEFVQELARTLPSYMVPRIMIELDTVPLTPSGKLDRKLLPDPRGYATSSARKSAPPSTATECAVAEVWAAVLGARDVAVDDDFFALGGHSLLAVQLVQQLNAAFRTALPLSLVFEARTVRSQAERIDHGTHDGGVTAIPLKRAGAGAPLFCVCGINLYQPLAEQLACDRPVYGLLLPVEGQLFAGEFIELDARTMAREYIAAVRSVQPRGPYHLTGVSFGGVLAYEVARQLREQGEEVALLALLDVVLPDPLSPASLARSLPLPIVRTAVAVRERARDLTRRVVARVRRSEDEVGGRMAEQRDFRALHAYRDECYERATVRYATNMPSYDGHVLLVRARDQVKNMRRCAADYGWSRYVRGSLACVDVAGDHLGILAQPNVQELSAVLSAYL